MTAMIVMMTIMDVNDESKSRFTVNQICRGHFSNGEKESSNAEE